MRRVLYALVFCSCATRAMAINSTVNQVATAPSGACTSSTDPMQIVQGTGEIWACVSNAWSKLPQDVAAKVIGGALYADEFPGATTADKVAAALATCASDECTVIIPSKSPSGAWNAATLKDKQTVIDYRPTDQNTPWDLPYAKGIEAVTATSLGHTRTERQLPVGFSWSARFLSGGVNQNDATGAKDHYNPFTFTSIDFGETEGSCFNQYLAKNGRGDAFGTSFTTAASNNCMDNGDECSASLAGTLMHNQYIPAATITSVASASPGELISFNNGYDTSWVGQSRLVLDVRPGKVYSTGTVSGMTKGPVNPYVPYGQPGISDTDGTTITGSSTAWNTLCPSSSAPCDGTNLCFELVPDRLAIDLGTGNSHYYESAPGKLVYPVRKILSSTTLQLNPQMQGYLENYLGPSTSGSYRIYPCGSIYEVKTLLNNFQSPDTGTLQIVGNNGNWLADDKIEVPHPYANWGSVLKLYGQHFIDGKYGSEMISVYDYMDRSWPTDPSAPRTYRPFSAILGGSGQFTHGVDFWAMLFDNYVMRSQTGDILFGDQCNHNDLFTDAQCAHREKRFDNSEIPTGYPNQRQSQYFRYTYEYPTGTYTDSYFHIGPNTAYTYAADATTAANIKPRLDIGGLEVYSNGNISTGGASGTADTSAYLYALTNTYGLQMNMVNTAAYVFPMLVMRNGVQKLEFSCNPSPSTACTAKFRQSTEITVEDSGYNERARLGNGFLSVGAVPAAAGAVRLTNNQTVAARDAANAADVSVAKLNASNVVELGDATHGVLAPSSVAIGTNPAATGAVRLANTQSVSGRNAANSADVSLAKLNASNRVELSDATHVVYVPSSAAGNGLLVGTNGDAIYQLRAGSAPFAATSTGAGHRTISASVTNLPAQSACACSPRGTFAPNVVFEYCLVSSANSLTVQLFNTGNTVTTSAVTVDFSCSSK